MAFFMVMTLAACSSASGTGNAADPNADKYGTYTIVKLSVDGEELDQDVFDVVMQSMESQGSLFQIVVGENSYFEFPGSGQRLEVEIDFDSGIIKEKGANDSVPFVYDNGNIVIESEGVVMTFGR